MSPPCVATIFDGDNGGSTAAGVTGTAIRVAFPAVKNVVDRERPAVTALIEFFNRHFEFYGRRLEPVFVNSFSGGGFHTPATNRALGAELAAQNVFAVVPGGLERGNEAHMPLYRELARRGIISLPSNMGFWLSDELVFDELHPYVWAAYPSAEQIWQNFVDFSCAALVGGQARHAADPALRSRARKFGIVTTTHWVTPSATIPREGLEACGAEVVTVTIGSTPGSAPTEVRTAMQKLKDAGVTTVACGCAGENSYSLHYHGGQAIGFGPEYVSLGDLEPSGLADLMLFSYLGHQGGAFSLDWRPRLLPLQARPWFQALLETMPTLPARADHDDLWTPANVGARTYLPLLILAAGIQAAGPELNPQTFAAGLLSTPLANTGAGQAPYWQPAVGFGPGDHTFINDFALSWWDSSLDGMEAQQSGMPGSLCYLDRGARYRPGTWPKDADGRILDRGAACR